MKKVLYFLFFAAIIFFNETTAHGQCTPPPTLTISTPSTSVCGNGFALITSNLQYSSNFYEWYQDGNLVFSGLGAYYYNYRVVYSTTFKVRYYEIGNPSCYAAFSNELSIQMLPVPTLQIPPQQVICSGSTTNINLTTSNNISGTTYTWTVDPGSWIVGASDGSGNTIVQTLSDYSSQVHDVQYVRYNVTPMANGCYGSMGQAVVMVYPLPTIVANTQTTTCQGGVVDLSAWPDGGQFLKDGVVFAGTNVSGIGASVSGSYTFRLNAPGTPGCSATSQPVVVTVLPAPSPAITASSNPFCSGSTAVLSANAGPGNLSYNWINLSDHNKSVGGDPTYTATTPGDYYVSVINSDCLGTPYSGNYSGASPVMTLNVNVAYDGGITGTSNGYICGGTAPTFTPIQISIGSGPLTYQWQTSPDGNVFSAIPGATNTSYTAPPMYQNAYFRKATTSTVNNVACTAFSNNQYMKVTNVTPGTIAGDQTVCPGGNPNAFSETVAATGTVTPTYQWQFSEDNVNFYNIDGATGATYDPPVLPVTKYYKREALVLDTNGTMASCTAFSNTITVTVGKPVASALSPTICSGQSPNIQLTSSIAGTTYSWPIPIQTNVSGGSAAANVPGTTGINQILTAGIPSGTATYTVTPSANGCSGTAITVIVTVNAAPTATAPSPSICSGTTTTISLSSNITGTTFSWPTPTMTNATGGSSGAVSTIQQSLTDNSSTQSGQVTYNITPVSPAGCTGSPLHVTVTVNPIPVGSAGTQTINSGQTSSLALSSSVTSASTSFSWGIPTQTSVTGGTSGSGTTIAQLLTNPSNAISGNATYAVTPVSSGCTGNTFPAVINVNPAVPLVGNIFSNPIQVGMLSLFSTYTDVKNNSTSNLYGNDYTGPTNQPSDDIFYRFFVNGSCSISISTQSASPIDTYIHLVSSSGKELISNDDNGSGGLWSALRWNIEDADYYYLVVEGYYLSSGSITSTITVALPTFPTVGWTDLVGVSVSGNTVTKTNSSFTWSAGAASTNYIPANADGWMEMTINNINWDIMFGLSSSNPDATWSSIEYNCYISRRNGYVVELYKLGSLLNSNASAYAVGDKFRVERKGSTMYFKRNGVTIGTTAGNSAEVLRADISMFDPSSQIYNAISTHTSSGGQMGSRAIVFPENLSIGSYNTSDSTVTHRTSAFTAKTISPNPTTGKFTISYGLDDNKDQVRIKVLNPLGTQIYSTIWNPKETDYQLSVDLENQAAGVYVIYVDEKIFKLIKN